MKKPHYFIETDSTKNFKPVIYKGFVKEKLKSNIRYMTTEDDNLVYPVEEDNYFHYFKYAKKELIRRISHSSLPKTYLDKIKKLQAKDIKCIKVFAIPSIFRKRR